MSEAQSASAQESLELEEAAHRALIEEHGQNANRRYVGYFFSQSLKQLMEYVRDPERVQQLYGRRRVQENSTEPLEGRELAEYAQATLTENLELQLDYDRAEHREFRWDELRDWLEENRSIWDVPLSRAVIRIDDNGILEEAWKEFIKNATEPFLGAGQELSTGWVEPPFYAVMEARSPGTSTARRNIESFHDRNHYFMPPSEHDGEHQGLGWKPRGLDLQAVWSHRAFVDIPDIIATRNTPTGKEELTPRKVEDLLINFYDSDQPRIGAINSKFLISKWKQSCFDRAVDQKTYEWREREGWIQVNNS